MTRFKKEMAARFPYALRESDDGEAGAYVIEEEALIVFYNPSLCTVLRFLRNGKQKEVTADYPRISAPYLVHLLGGDEDRAREILRGQSF